MDIAQMGELVLVEGVGILGMGWGNIAWLFGPSDWKVAKIMVC